MSKQVKGAKIMAKEIKKAWSYGHKQYLNWERYDGFDNGSSVFGLCVH